MAGSSNGGGGAPASKSTSSKKVRKSMPKDSKPVHVPVTAPTKQPSNSSASTSSASTPERVKVEATVKTTAPAGATVAGATTTTATTTTLFLLRHGDRWDYANKEQWAEAAAALGREARDPPLSALGHRQAECAARSVLQLLDAQGAELGAIISSPYLRAIQTAQPLAQLSGVPIAADDALAEAWHSPGSIEPPAARWHYLPDISLQHKPLLTMRAPAAGNGDAPAGAPACSEQFPDAYLRRMVSLGPRLLNRYAGQAVACFSHAASVAAVAALTGQSLSAAGTFSPCGIFHLTHNSQTNKWTLHRSNYIPDHAPPLSPTTFPWGFMNVRAVPVAEADRIFQRILSEPVHASDEMVVPAEGPVPASDEPAVPANPQRLAAQPQERAAGTIAASQPGWLPGTIAASRRVVVASHNLWLIPFGGPWCLGRVDRCAEHLAAHVAPHAAAADDPASSTLVVAAVQEAWAFRCGALWPLVWLLSLVQAFLLGKNLCRGGREPLWARAASAAVLLCAAGQAWLPHPFSLGIWCPKGRIAAALRSKGLKHAVGVGRAGTSSCSTSLSLFGLRPSLLDSGLLLCSSHRPDRHGFTPYSVNGPVSGEAVALKGLLWAVYGDVAVVNTHMTAELGARAKAVQREEVGAAVAALLAAEPGVRHVVLAGDLNHSLGPSPVIPAHGAVSAVLEAVRRHGAGGVHVERVSGDQATNSDGTIDHILYAVKATAAEAERFRVTDRTVVSDEECDVSDHCLVCVQLSIDDSAGADADRVGNQERTS